MDGENVRTRPCRELCGVIRRTWPFMVTQRRWVSADEAAAIALLHEAPARACPSGGVGAGRGRDWSVDRAAYDLPDPMLPRGRDLPRQALREGHLCDLAMRLVWCRCRNLRASTVLRDSAAAVGEITQCRLRGLYPASCRMPPSGFGRGRAVARFGPLNGVTIGQHRQPAEGSENRPRQGLRMSLEPVLRLSCRSRDVVPYSRRHPRCSQCGDRRPPLPG